MGLLRMAYSRAVIAVLRPYIRRELPGWGLLFDRFIGAAEKDYLWAGEQERWIRGKMHQYEMSVRISGWSNRAAFFLGRFYDLPTQLLIQHVLRPGDTFVDIGANEGMMTLVAARAVGPSGQVIAFEPNPVPRAILERTLSRNGIDIVVVHGVGLSNMRGTLELSVPFTNTGEGSFTELGVPGTKVSCPVAVADELLGGDDPTLVKIDVEGFEMRVLEGLAGTIAKSRSLISIEMIASHLRRDESTPDKIIEWFQARGYVGRRLSTRRHGHRRRLALSDLGSTWRDGDYVWGTKILMSELETKLRTDA